MLFLVKKRGLRLLIETPNKDIWYVTQHEAGLLEISDGGVYKKLKKRPIPELTGKTVGAFEEIYMYDKENVFIGNEEGFIHYNPSWERDSFSIQTQIRSVFRLKMIVFYMQVTEP